MSFARSDVAALAIGAFVFVGCNSDGVQRAKPATLTKSQMLDQASQMNAEGQRLRAEAVQKKRQGQAADKQFAQADKMITDAKLMKDEALLRDSKVSD